MVSGARLEQVIDCETDREDEGPNTVFQAVTWSGKHLKWRCLDWGVLRWGPNAGMM
jgi:hypothetical protein